MSQRRSNLFILFLLLYLVLDIVYLDFYLLLLGLTAAHGRVDLPLGRLQLILQLPYLSF